MAETIWADRLRRALLIARAPWLFATVQSYRHALVKGMQQAEILVQSGVRRFIPPPTQKDRMLQLVLRQGPAAVNLVVSTIAFDLGESEEGRLAVAILRVLIDLDLDVRLIAVAESSFPHEARVRAWLQAQGVLAPSDQARLEMLDGTGPFVPVGPQDVFLVTAGKAEAALLRERFSGRDRRAEIHVVCGERGPAGASPENIAELVVPTGASPQEMRAVLAGIVGRLTGQVPPRFAERSRLGLGYRMLKPLAPDHAPGRTCLFVHFDPQGRIDPHVLRYLSALKACGFDIVLISSGDLQAEALAAVDALTVAAITRQNKGLDFSGWALALELFPSLLQSQSLLIANDSVYGPVGDLPRFFEQMEAQALDVWGAIESRDIERHFQSWLVHFARPVLRSEAFRAFWSGVLPLDDKRAVIHQYEVPMWRVFQTAGFRVGAAVPWEGHELANNPTMHGWRALLRLGAPFVKVQLLRDNPVSSNLDGWIAEMRRRGYPVELVVDHLYRVRGPEAAAFKAE
jgi:hypothetical protein